MKKNQEKQMRIFVLSHNLYAAAVMAVVSNTITATRSSIATAATTALLSLEWWSERRERGDSTRSRAHS